MTPAILYQRYYCPIPQGTFLMTQALARTLSSAAGEDQDPIAGAVVNVSSVVAKGGNMGQSNYASSKAAVEAFTKTAAKELARWLGYTLIVNPFRSLAELRLV